MDSVSYSLASKQAQRIKKIIANPDSTSGIVTVPKTIASGETITIPTGRVAVLPNVQIDGVLNIENGGEVFIPSGTTFGDLDQRIDTLDSTTVKKTGDQTIAGTKIFSSNIVGNITGNAATATNVSGGRAIVYGTGNDYHLGGVEVNGNGTDNTVFPTIGFHQQGLYASSLQLRGGGDFRFYTQGAGSYANVTANSFIGNLSGNAATATTLSTNRTNYKFITDSSVAGELMWKNYGNNHTIFDASNSTTPTGKAIDNKNPDTPWVPTFPTLMGYNGTNTYGVRVDSSRVADSAAAFTTAVGSAPSYACRAWVNFNGTGTVAIRASGNVSSITDNGVGNYTVNFTTAMPDDNYSVATSSRQDGDSSENVYAMRVGRGGAFSTTGVTVVHGYHTNLNYYADCLYGLVSIFR